MDLKQSYNYIKYFRLFVICSETLSFLTVIGLKKMPAFVLRNFLFMLKQPVKTIHLRCYPQKGLCDKDRLILMLINLIY